MSGETQKTISDWAEQTFGPSGPLPRIAARANEEMAELLKGLTFCAEPHQLVEEAADVKIVLYRLAERLGFDLDERLRPWASERLGVEGHAAQANEALARALCYLVADHPAAAGWRVVDCLGHLDRFTRVLGYNLADEVDRKMAINRARGWRLDDYDHGDHLPATPSGSSQSRAI